MSRLTLSSGLGPVEVRHFVRQLADALVLELRERGLEVTARVEHGPAAEPRSVDLVVRSARGSVADLLGTHALVMRSARRGKRDRKRWYVGVSVAQHGALRCTPLDASEVRFETCRAGGAGGQHVNKTESAVRAYHVPSGITVRIESERSQHQNKRRALEELSRALAARAAAQRAELESARRRRALQVERGAPVATWALRGEALERVTTSREERVERGQHAS